MTPLAALQHKIATGEITEDPRQLAIMQRLEQLYHELTARENPNLWQRLRLTSSQAPQGVYLWGHVGTGKSFLIDLFFDCLPTKKKLRIHFHAFMRRIHAELKTLQGQKDPLKLVAKKLAEETHILCFDEFFVNDIADAMLLAGLLKAMFNQGICLVTNSNCAPDELYKKGMLRERFLPAIALIKAHTDVIHIATTHDYRLRHILEAGVYFTPLGAKASQEMEEQFRHYAKNRPASQDPITLLNRPIAIQKQAGDVIWFDFKQICGIPRCQNDYLELSRLYQTVLVSQIPVINARQEDLITSFIKLVDVFYDEKIRLIISADTACEAIYPTGPLSFEYQRTCSRLIEMQSKDYFDEKLADHLI